MTDADAWPALLLLNDPLKLLFAGTDAVIAGIEPDDAAAPPPMFRGVIPPPPPIALAGTEAGVEIPASFGPGKVPWKLVHVATVGSRPFCARPTSRSARYNPSWHVQERIRNRNAGLQSRCAVTRSRLPCRLESAMSHIYRRARLEPQKHGKAAENLEKKRTCFNLSLGSSDFFRKPAAA